MAGLPRIDFEECLPDEMILVLDAVQGIGKEIGQCQYRNGDCVEPTTTQTDNKLRDECIGKSSCAITVSVAWMPKCSAYSSYNQVLYQCIPGTVPVTLKPKSDYQKSQDNLRHPKRVTFIYYAFLFYLSPQNEVSVENKNTQ